MAPIVTSAEIERPAAEVFAWPRLHQPKTQRGKRTLPLPARS